MATQVSFLEFFTPPTNFILFPNWHVTLFMDNYLSLNSSKSPILTIIFYCEKTQKIFVGCPQGLENTKIRNILLVKLYEHIHFYGFLYLYMYQYSLTFITLDKHLLKPRSIWVLLTIARAREPWIRWNCSFTCLKGICSFRPSYFNFFMLTVSTDRDIPNHVHGYLILCLKEDSKFCLNIIWLFSINTQLRQLYLW